MQNEKPKVSKPKSYNICRINTEGVEYTLNWDKMPVGGFVFIRCVQTKVVENILRRSAQKYGVKLSLRAGAYNSFWGIGVWRVR